MQDSDHEHVPLAEIAELYEAAVREEETLDDIVASHPHLAECALCRERLLKCADLDRRLKVLPIASEDVQKSDCPDPLLWADIATGVMDNAPALRYIQHASGCDLCGRRLKQAVIELSAEVTPREKSLLDSLPSAREEWARSLAKRIAGSRTSASWVAARWLTLPRLALAGVGLAGLALAGLWFTSNRNHVRSVSQLLAKAYSDQRTFELRIPGARYATPRVQLGEESSFANRSPALLKAETIIADQLPSQPDASWLQVKAQADLLEGRYDPAVQSLRRALQQSPNSAGIMIDLATAYFQRGLVNHSPEDYSIAYEQLSRALEVQPDSPVALFNRAIVAERQYLYQQALDDWDRYLRLDPDSDWAKEARQRADSVRAKIKAKQTQGSLLSPSDIAGRLNDPALPGVIEPRLDQYLDLATYGWLPEAYPERTPAPPSARVALFFLAELTKSRGDPWLSDLLEGENLPGFGSAARTLGQARRSNMTAEYGRARDLAQQAKTWFQANSNQAGALRALFEISFSEQVDRHVGDCRRHADEGLRLAEASAYGWLVIQLALEEGICRGLGGEISGAKRLETLAVARSQELGYSTLHLRALNLVANDQADDGDHAQAWRTSLHGMEMYWSGQTAVMPGFNFYVNLAYAAEDRGRPHLALALQRETVRLIDSDPDLLLRASSHSALARTAAKVNELQTAETQYLEAERLFSLAPQTDAVRESRREEETRYAQFDVQRGQADAALARLTRIEPEMRNLTNDYLAQLFYSTLGEVQLRRNQPRQAEIALQPALAISERNLKYMRTESERTAWSKLAAPIYLGLVEAELAQGRVEDSLATFEWYLGASQRAGRASPRREKPSGASWLHPRLAKLADKTILTYAALPGGLAIWVYDDRGLYFHWLPDRNATAWEDLVARLDDACSDPKSNLAALQRDSRSLYGLLIAPIEEHIDFHRTLVIEADGWARRVPFEVLLDTQGRYLLSRATIVYSLGRSSDDILRPAAPIAPQSKALIVGSTGVFPGQLPPVGVQEQATDVTHHFEHTRLLLDRDVVLAKVTDDLRSAEVFHFAGHSQILSDRAAFVLEERDPATGKPRLLDANSLRDSKMPSLQLAVLAACSTADAHDTEDDEQGFHSMAGAFLRASVPRVVASRWPVDAVETRRFMDTFYRDLLSGIPVSQAVRATSLSVLANPHSAHPYYWSPFSVYGRE